jgi:uncharacterized phiE125 gp8 family phage protein
MEYKIITAVTTEPVTLAEAKAHLRANSDTFDGDVTAYQSISPALHSTAASYSLVGAAIDVLGKVSMAVLNAGACGTGGTIVVKLQESDDNSVWQDVTDGVFTTVSEATDNAVYEQAYVGVMQYIRAVATVATASCSFSVDILVKSGDTDEDTLIGGLITSAREYCEGITRRALATQTIEAYLGRFPCKDRFELPRPPLQSVTSVKYKDSAGTETTMTADTDYLVDTESNVGGVVLPYGVNWPTFTPYPLNPIKVRYVAGYTVLNPIPQMIKQAMMLHIGYFYNNRDAMDLDEPTDKAVKRMLTLYRSGWF